MRRMALVKSQHWKTHARALIKRKVDAVKHTTHPPIGNNNIGTKVVSKLSVQKMCNLQYENEDVKFLLIGKNGVIVNAELLIAASTVIHILKLV